MFERRNIEVLTAEANARQQKQIENMVAQRYKSDIQEREALSPEGMLAQEAINAIAAISKLAAFEKYPDIKISDLLFRRKEKVLRRQNRRVQSQMATLYTLPEVKGKGLSDFQKGIRLDLARREGPEALKSMQEKINSMPPNEKRYLSNDFLYALSFDLKRDATHFAEGQRFESTWRVQFLHQDHVSSGYLYRERLVEGPFYDVDIYRTTRIEGDEVSARAFHLRINDSDKSLRTFVAFGEDGLPKDPLLTKGNGDLERAMSILLTAQHEAEEDIRLLS